MQGVMDFLREQELKGLDRENKLIADKKVLEDRVRNLEEELAKQVAINIEMAKKIKMFEVSKKVVKNVNNTGTVLQQ
jgi:hypothetical protein